MCYMEDHNGYNTVVLVVVNINTGSLSSKPTPEGRGERLSRAGQ